MAKSNAERQREFRRRRARDRIFAQEDSEELRKCRRLVDRLRRKLEFYERFDPDGDLSREYDALMSNDEGGEGDGDP